jgi:26S proteasome regulatory subunit N5
MALVDSIADREERVEVLSTLKAVTDGKIYVEVERARITRKLAAQREAEGRIAEASETLQEVQIETYGSMEKAEKADFICEQVRLAVRQADFVRAGILSNKMNRKVLDEAGFEATRVRFYRLLDLIALHKHDSLALHKHAGAVMATTGYAADAALWRPVLASSLLYLALCPWSNEVSDLIHKALADRRLEELPAQRALLMWLTTKELIPWPLPAPFGPVIQGDAVFGIDLLTVGRGADAAPAGGDAMDVSAPGAGASAPATAASKVSSSLLLAEDEGRASSWAPILRKRIAQHNVRTLAGAYTRVKLSRAASLTGVDPPTLEALLSELVSSKALYARIDRPAGVVTFAPKRAADTVLASWGDDLEGLLNLVDRTHHLIEKEAQVHGVVLTAA